MITKRCLKSIHMYFLHFYCKIIKNEAANYIYFIYHSYLILDEYNVVERTSPQFSICSSISNPRHSFNSLSPANTNGKDVISLLIQKIFKNKIQIITKVVHETYLAGCPMSMIQSCPSPSFERNALGHVYEQLLMLFSFQIWRKFHFFF